MKRFLLIVILILAVLVFTPLAVAKSTHRTTHRAKSSPCPELQDITECPEQGCGGDPELNKRKNITSNDQPAKPVTIEEMKEKPNPDRTRFRSDHRDRDVLKEMGEGDKVIVVAWTLTARKGNPESCNCGLDKPKDTDNHIVLVDLSLKQPVLNLPTEKHSVTAEFTPRVKREQPKMTRDRLGRLIDPNWDGGKNNPQGRLKVRVTGQLMFDSEHYFGKHLNRENDWEIHPILKFEYCPHGKQCSDRSDENWKDLESD